MSIYLEIRKRIVKAYRDWKADPTKEKLAELLYNVMLLVEFTEEEDDG
jgi:hypothetical protein